VEDVRRFVHDEGGERALSWKYSTVMKQVLSSERPTIEVASGPSSGARRLPR